MPTGALACMAGQRTRHPVCICHLGPAAVLCGVAPREQAAPRGEVFDFLQMRGRVGASCTRHQQVLPVAGGDV